MIRVLIVAAYASVRAGLNALLSETPECEVVGTVAGSADLARHLPEAHPDVVLFDYNEGDGARVLETVSGTDVALMLLGDDLADYRMLAGLPLRGWAFLLKEAEREEIVNAARAAAAGLIAFDRGVAPLLIADSSAPVTTGFIAPGETLTVREREVLQLMAQGLPNKLIASRLNISLHTVKFHVASILAKLGAGSRTEAVTLGARNGYVSL